MTNVTFQARVYVLLFHYHRCYAQNYKLKDTVGSTERCEGMKLCIGQHSNGWYLVSMRRYQLVIDD